MIEEYMVYTIKVPVKLFPMMKVFDVEIGLFRASDFCFKYELSISDSETIEIETPLEIGNWHNIYIC